MLTFATTSQDVSGSDLTWPVAFALSAMIIPACATIAFVMWLLFRKR